MSTTVAAKITLKELMNDLIPKSKYPLAAIFEAITNSLESISERGNEGEITINLFFKGLFEEGKELERIEIIDNGIGFTDRNFERFGLLLDKSKGFNNRGSGRIQFLHRSNRVSIESYYLKGDKIFKRTFICDPINFISRAANKPTSISEDISTKITFMELTFSEAEKRFFDTLEIDELKKEIKNKFLLRLYLDKKKENYSVPKIKVNFFKNEKPMASKTIDPAEIPEPIDSGIFEVNYSKSDFRAIDDFEWKLDKERKEIFNWAHFKLQQSELDQNNVFLCSKNVQVESFPIKQIKKGDNLAGHRYLTVIYGKILDDEKYVSHSVDKFKFPHKSEIEKSIREDLFFDPKEEFLFYDDIEDGVQEVVEKVYSEIASLSEKKKTSALDIAKAHGMSPELVDSIKISLTDNEQQITDKLYKKHAEVLSKNNQRIKALYESLNSLNPIEENYQNDLQNKSSELLELIPQQNKEELSRYIIRREMVTNILNLILNKGLNYQVETKEKSEKERKDPEGLIHNLIFKRKEKSTSSLNDLWILNEEFVHFEGCSDLPISQIEIPNHGKLLKKMSKDEIDRFGLKPNRRPDIFLFPEEGKCILIELKEPKTDLSDHIHQTTKYANLIANYSNISIDTFYCFLIGENLKQIDIPGDYEKTVNNDWVRKIPLPVRSIHPQNEGEDIAKIQFEIIKLSSIHSRAHRRNKSFADRLGIRIEDLK